MIFGDVSSVLEAHEDLCVADVLRGRVRVGQAVEERRELRRRWGQSWRWADFRGRTCEVAWGVERGDLDLVIADGAAFELGGTRTGC